MRIQNEDCPSLECGKNFCVVKRHQRLFIIDNQGNSVYTPPNFIRHRIGGRGPLKELCDAFNRAGCFDIVAVMEFETKFNPKVGQRKRNS